MLQYICRKVQWQWFHFWGESICASTHLSYQSRSVTNNLLVCVHNAVGFDCCSSSFFSSLFLCPPETWSRSYLSSSDSYLLKDNVYKSGTVVVYKTGLLGTWQSVWKICLETYGFPFYSTFICHWVDLLYCNANK